MKSPGIPSASFRASVFLTVLAILTSTQAPAQSPRSPRPRQPAIDHSTFYLLAFNGTLVHGKCLDFGPPPQVAGAPVFIFGCNGTIAQQVRVEEINDRHEVVLHAGTLVIGARNPVGKKTSDGAHRATVPTEYALELQSRTDPSRVDSANQIFALDGDSIILASSSCRSMTASDCLRPQPQLVVTVENARGKDRTPLVVGPRNFADSEFWDFQALDRSGKDPTTGFQRVSTAKDFVCAIDQVNQIAHQNNGAAWGRVIKVIDSGNPIDLTDLTAYPGQPVPTGVTIRGDRRGTLLGPELLEQFNPTKPNAPALSMFSINGDYVRITGLRLQGPTTSTTATILPVNAITAPDGVATGFIGTAIDHNDISAWTNAGVEVYGDSEARGAPGDGMTTCPLPDPTLDDRVRINRNFIHHNDESDGDGYGTVMSYGGSASILGNTFLMNRHSIAGDGSINDQYTAWANLVLSRAPVYNKHDVEQTFDMHGEKDGYGGYAGNALEVAWNTFLPTDSDNIDVRGQSCAVNSFHNNVSTRASGNAIKIWDAADFSKDGGQFYPSSMPFMQIQNNQFADSSPAYSDPTVRLGVGNFDGDSMQDLFLATGAAWYYSPGGNAEWRYLNGGKTDRIDSLLLGDFDGDGRTDVVGMNGRSLMVSWGGISDWEVLNNSVPVGASIKDLAVGDFDDDGRDDLFYGDGTHWFVSSGGSGTFNQTQHSTYRVKDLRFGHFSVCDFEGLGKTDVFGIVAGKWHVSCGATESWVPLPVSLTNKIDGLIVADFDGNGRADVVTFDNPLVTGWRWAVSKDAAAGWIYHEITPTTEGPEPCPFSIGIFSLPSPASSLFVGVGRFSGNQSDDILMWGSNFGNNFCIVAGGTGAAERRSRQDMR